MSEYVPTVEERQEAIERSLEDDGYRLFVNEARTVLVRFWTSGTVEVCTREFDGGIWGPPVVLVEENVA